MLIDSATQNALAGAGGIVPRWLLWVEAKNRTTGASEAAGLWNDGYDRNFIIDGVTRAYSGAAGMIAPGALTVEAGTNIQMQRISIAILEPRIETMIRFYDARLAPAELHLALFNSGDELISLTRVFRGFIDSAPIREGELSDGTSSAICELTLASSAREGTRTLTLKKSEEALKRRGGDRGYRYSTISGSVPVWWGEERSTPAPATSVPKKIITTLIDR